MPAEREPRRLLDGGRYFEGPRWQAGRLWFVDCGPQRRTLFCLSAATSPEETRQRKSSARIDIVDVETLGAGYP